MAETKTLKTRIALLYKSYAEWDAVKATYVPLKGEVCFCEVPASTGVSQTEPCVLFKVGDGTKTFETLPWGSGLAADVFAWAKKENLQFSDLTTEFKEAIKEYVGGEETNTLYQIVSTATNKWQLQKSDDKGVTWVDATGTIDLSATISALESAIDAEVIRANAAESTLQANIDAEETRAKAEEAKKVDKELTSAAGKALIFNEADGGGAKFENADGTESFVGVNNGGATGIAAQIYADKLVEGKWQGAKLDVYNEGIYYTVGNQTAAQRKAAENELATLGDIAEYSMIKDADPGQYAAIYHLTKDGVNVGEPINIAKDQLLKSVTVKTCTEKDKPIPGLVVGDKYIDFEFETTEGTSHSYIAVKDMVKPYTADEETLTLSAENQFSVKAVPIEKVTGLQAALDLKATEAALNTEISNRTAADTALQTNIDAEETRAKGVEATKADLPAECPPWLNPTGQTPYPWFMASLDVESTGLGPDAEGNLNVNVGAYNFNAKQYYKWEKSLPFAATTAKAGLMTAADKTKLDGYADGKLNVLPKVDDPTDPGFGWEYHIPYRFDVSLDAEKANIDLHTLTLDNKVTKMVFNKQVPGATQSTAGLMTAADKAKLDHFYAKDLNQEEGDVLILNCNF